MNCQEVTLLMQRDLDHDLDGQGKNELERHLASCKECAEMYDRLKRLAFNLENLPKVEPKYSLVDAILPQLDLIDREKFADEQAAAGEAGSVQVLKKEKKRKGFWLPAIGPAAAALLFALVLLDGEKTDQMKQSASLNRLQSDARWEIAMDGNGGNAGEKAPVKAEKEPGEPMMAQPQPSEGAEGAGQRQNNGTAAISLAMPHLKQIAVTNQRADRDEPPLMQSASRAEPKGQQEKTEANETYLPAAPEPQEEASSKDTLEYDDPALKELELAAENEPETSDSGGSSPSLDEPVNALAEQQSAEEEPKEDTKREKRKSQKKKQDEMMAGDHTDSSSSQATLLGNEAPEAGNVEKPGKTDQPQPEETREGQPAVGDQQPYDLPGNFGNTSEQGELRSPEKAEAEPADTGDEQKKEEDEDESGQPSDQAGPSPE